MTVHTPIAQRVLDALGGPGGALRRLAGDLLDPLIDGYCDPMADIDARTTLTQGGWAQAFDLDLTPDPVWLGRATGSKVPDGLTVEQARDYVRGQAYWRRGTPAAMTAAVQALLTGLKRVGLAERDTSPWHLTITVIAADVPAGVTVTDIYNAALAQKPVGIVLAAQIVTSATYAHFHDPATHGGTYTSVAAAFPTYADRSTHAPEGGTTP